MRQGLLVGGNWNNGASCDSRCANCNNVSSNVNANNGARGASDTKGNIKVRLC